MRAVQWRLHDIQGAFLKQKPWKCNFLAVYFDSPGGGGRGGDPIRAPNDHPRRPGIGSECVPLSVMDPGTCPDVAYVMPQYAWPPRRGELAMDGTPTTPSQNSPTETPPLMMR